MKILIPTRGRSTKQYTAKHLQESGIDFTLVLNSDDNESYEYPTVKVQASNIVEKRQAIIDLYGYDKLIMFDDDMKFFTRNELNHFESSTADELRALYLRIKHELNSFLHVGVASRFMANYRLPDYEIGGRYIRILAYNFQLLSGSRPRYRFPGHEDHDFNMQLQDMGYLPKVLTCYAQDDHGQFNPGGCSTWRTSQSDIEEMKRFAEAWPGIVSFSKPNEKNPIGRMRIAWSKLRDKSSEKQVRNLLI